MGFTNIHSCVARACHWIPLADLWGAPKHVSPCGLVYRTSKDYFLYFYAFLELINGQYRYEDLVFNRYVEI
jgi:hypothetical protein